MNLYLDEFIEHQKLLAFKTRVFMNGLLYKLEPFNEIDHRKPPMKRFDPHKIKIIKTKWIY